MIKKFFCHFLNELLGSLEKFYPRDAMWNTMQRKKNFSDLEIQDQSQFCRFFICFSIKYQGVDSSVIATDKFPCPPYIF